MRVFRKHASSGLAVDRLVAIHEVAQVVGGEVEVALGAALLLHLRDGRLEALAVDAHHHVAKHVDQAAIGVVGKAGVAGLAGEPFHHLAVKAEVEDRVHHAGHRLRGAGADRHEQRVFGVAERAVHRLLHVLQSAADLLVEARRPRLVVLHKVLARLGRDGEAGRHG